MLGRSHIIAGQAKDWHILNRAQVISDLTFAVVKAFPENGIEIRFPTAGCPPEKCAERYAARLASIPHEWRQDGSS
jgi:hypothetical protein